tara:strand:+ start:5407 stop:5928 length:522 start_codon:yes stop_codon:yes gene_type:complete
MQFLAISGSLRSASTNAGLLNALQGFMPDGCQINRYDELADLPIFNPDLEGSNTPAVVERLATQVSDADGLIVSSPEYVHGIPGGLKNLFDWLTSRFEVVDKPILVVHASHRGDIALDALLDVLGTLSKKTVPEISIRIPLVSCTPEEVRKTIAQPEYSGMIASGLDKFIASI